MPMSESSFEPPGWRRQQRGLSLIELMVAIAIGLLLVAFMLRGFVASSGSSAVNSSVSEFQTNGRYALETLTREIRHAALSPLLWEQAQLEVSAAAAARDFGCGSGSATGVIAGVAATNNANPYSSSCLAGSATRQYLRGDVLTLRRLGLAPVASASLANAPYVRTSYAAGRFFLGGETPATLPAPSYDYPVVNDIYFINDFTTSPDESPKVPALYRMTLSTGANPVLVPELVASNVEHLQFQFAVGNASGNVRYLDPDAVTDWAQVKAVRIWILLRASTSEAGFASGSYTLGDQTYAPGDAFRRVVLSSTVEIRNR